ncbi:chromate efflux transporter [Gilvimarinus sp. F26214L]|uniref:chromate efflux transporter n=1 Tax=Gilvimarinus sp. DZF01 TaxID=3461371 RepID=UPI00404579E7
MNQRWTRIREIFEVFSVLGLTSFGGPVAHLGYFRAEFVVARKWLSEQDYADLVALCQFLPGPASSQVGFALGLQRGGLLGALTAWAAFTLPSAVLLVAFAYSGLAMRGAIGEALVHGLKLVAVAVVAQAVWGMARHLCPDRNRASIAVGAVVLVALLPTAIAQITAILFGGLAGLWLCRNLETGETGRLPMTIPRCFARAALLSFFVLLIGLPASAMFITADGLALFEAFYRAGALVFGGGHVVLPLLESTVVASGWAGQDSFLAGYGAAQAIPGPLFTFAAYLGAVVNLDVTGPAGATIALVAIFLPGMLLLIGVLPYWDTLRGKIVARSLMAGANAAVVGLLASALYDPVWISSVLSPLDFAIALIAFVLLSAWKMAPWKVVVITAALGSGNFLLI